MPRRGWRYFATRLNGDGTETMLHADLPLSSVRVEQTLSGDGLISGSIEPVFGSLLAADGQPLLDEYSTAIYAENNGEIRQAGILLNSELEGASWEIEAPSFTSYGRDLPYIGGGYKGIEVDPMDVARTIWTHIQGKRNGDIGLEFDTTDTDGEVSIGTELKQVEFDTESGPISFESGPYKLNVYTNHDLQGDFDDLASETPFDYLETHSWQDDGTIRHFVKMGYPSLGIRREDVSFTFGVNIFEPQRVQRNGETYASGTLVLGAGEGAAMIRAVRENPEAGTRLRRIAVVLDDTIKSARKAEKRADAENKWRSRMNDIESIVVRDHPNAPLGSVTPGDEIYLKGKGSGQWLGIGMWVRVLAIAFEPDSGNVAEYTVARTDKLVS